MSSVLTHTFGLTAPANGSIDLFTFPVSLNQSNGYTLIVIAKDFANQKAAHFEVKFTYKLFGGVVSVVPAVGPVPGVTPVIVVSNSDETGGVNIAGNWELDVGTAAQISGTDIKATFVNGTASPVDLAFELSMFRH